MAGCPLDVHELGAYWDKVEILMPFFCWDIPVSVGLMGTFLTLRSIKLGVLLV